MILLWLFTFGRNAVAVAEMLAVVTPAFEKLGAIGQRARRSHSRLKRGWIEFVSLPRPLA